MKYRSVLLSGAIVLLIIFTGLSRAIKHGAMKSIDFDTTVRLQDKIPARFDEVMDDGAILADALVSSVVMLGLTGLAFFRSRKKINLRALVIPLAFVLIAFVEIYGKTTLAHAGPPFFMVKHPTTIFPKFTMMEPYSYPSGHASSITFVGLVFLFLLLPKFKSRAHQLLASGLVLGYMAFIYVSRIYLGHHWLSDIIGGVLLGGAMGLLNFAFVY